MARGRWRSAAALLAALGATLGVGLDGMHVATGTTAYAHPVLLGMAWWAPPLFAAAAVAMGLARPLAERMTDRLTAHPRGGAAATGVALFVLAYLVSGLRPFPSAVLGAVIAVLFLCAWRTSDGTALGLLLAAGTAVIGTAVEIGLTAAGAFTHARQEIGGVAAWLPALYATGQVGVGALGKRLVDAWN